MKVFLKTKSGANAVGDFDIQILDCEKGVNSITRYSFV